jgi:hypothetical protein
MKDLPVVLLVLDQTNHASRRRGNDPVARSTQDYTLAFGAAKGNTSLAHFGTAFNGRRNDYVSSISGQPWFRFATLSWSPDIIFYCRDRSHYFSIQCPLWVKSSHWVHHGTQIGTVIVPGTKTSHPRIHRLDFVHRHQGRYCRQPLC